MTRLRISGWCVLGVALFALGCADLKALSQLSADLQREYHVAVGLSISNGTTLTITFPQTTIDEMKLDGAASAAFARRVAQFALTHYANAGALEHINVTSAETTSDGTVTITRTQPSHTFAVRDLSGAP